MKKVQIESCDSDIPEYESASSVNDQAQILARNHLLSLLTGTCVKNVMDGFIWHSVQTLGFLRGVIHSYVYL